MRSTSLLTSAFFCVVLGWSSCLCSVLFSSTSQDSLYIGDRIHFSVSLLVPKASQVVPPVTDNGFGKLIVKEWTSDKVDKKIADSCTFNYILTTYTAENCTIPSLDYVVTQGAKTDTLRTKAVPLRVVLVSFPDSAKIKDLKPQQSAGVPSFAWLWWLICLALAAAAVYLVRRRLKKKAAPPAAIPLQPPYEEAIEALDRLEAKQYIAKGMIREYVFELSEIAKRYVERRFEVPAAEFTTEEILSWIRRSPLEPQLRKVLDRFFTMTDPVKFAKWIPDIDTVYRFGTDVRSFVGATRPQALPAEKTVHKETKAPHAV
jgi:hypothetical protein